MKKYTKAFILSFFILILSSIHAAEKTDPYEQVFLYARALELGGAAEQAQTEYKRYIFMQDYSEGLHQTECFDSLAGLYAQDQSWDLAADSIYRVILSATREGLDNEYIDSLRLRHIYYLRMQCQAEKTPACNNLLFFSYMNLPDFSQEVKKAALCQDLKNAVEDYRWDYARTQYNRTVAEFPGLFTQQENEIINQSFDNIQNYKPKKQMLAGYLSFFPGLGQLYAGDYLDSLNAFLLNGSIIAVSVYSICTMDLWTFSLLEFPPLRQFMKGNIYNAQKDAYYHNLRKIDEYSEPIKNILSSR